MAASVTVFICTLCIGLVTSAAVQESSPRDPFDVAWQLSFDGLEAAGCLPDDFSPPDISPCVEQGSAGGPAMYQALTCVAERSRIYSSDGPNINRIYELFNNMSSESSWTSQQKKNVDICKTSYNTSIPMTPEQQATFIMSCVRRLQNHQCRLIMMQRLDTDDGIPGATQPGQALALMLDGSCVDTVRNPEDIQALSRCTNGNGLNFTHVSDGMDWAKRYTNLLVDASDPGTAVAPPSQVEMQAIQEQMALHKSAILCTMRTNGLIDRDGFADYPRILQSVVNSSGKHHLKQTKSALIKECQKQKANTADEFVQCYFVSAPYACTSLYAHMLVLLRGYNPGDLDEDRKPEDVAVATTLSFDGLEAAGCLPDDFSPPDLSPCVEQGSAGGPALYQALGCAAKSLKVTDSSGLDVNAMYSMIGNMSSDTAWTSQQTDNVQTCLAMHNDTLLTTLEEKGIFMLICTRRLEKHQCRQHVLRQAGANTNVEGILEWGDILVQWLDGSCIDSVKNAEEDRAFVSCSEGTDLNMAVVGAAIGLAGLTTHVVEGGSSTIDKLPVPTRSDTLAHLRQLQLFQSAISCMARATGEIRPDGTVDYRRAQQLISQSAGTPELKQLESAVVAACEKLGVTDGEAYLKCHYKTAAYGCQSLKSHVFVLTKGETPPNM